MLPNFLIIGAQKAGSSWLGEMLHHHPDVFVCRTGELHFFNARFKRGLEWYEKNFESVAGERAVGEKTPMYLSHPLAAERIKSTLGEDVRMIVSLRHPVDRAHSQYWHDMRHGRIHTETEFVEAFREREQLRMEGMYGQHLTRFYELFPRENMLVFIFEEMIRNRRGALRACFEFLGVDSEFQPSQPDRRVNQARDVALLSPQLHKMRTRLKQMPSFLQTPLVQLGRQVFRVLPRERRYDLISEDVRQELLGAFSDDIGLLEEALGRDLSIWRTPRPQKAGKR